MNNPVIRWIGLALYLLSFFLYAVGSQPPVAPSRGWPCAVEAFVLPLYYILGGLFTGQGPFMQLDANRSPQDPRLQDSAPPAF